MAVRAGGRSYHGSGNNHHASMSPNKLNRVIMNQNRSKIDQNVGGKALSPQQSRILTEHSQNHYSNQPITGQKAPIFNTSISGL